jgi:soluble lytic murein transglycosylase-like protein
VLFLAAAMFAAGVAVAAVPSKKPAAEKIASLIEQADKKPGMIGSFIGKITAGRRLGEDDAARYAHIFAFQDVGDFAMADEEIAKLDDARLMGHVLYQRYMHADYKADYNELAQWMKHYADHPGAQGVYELAQKRQPADAGRLPAPRLTRGVSGQYDFDVRRDLAQSAPVRQKFSPRARDIIRSVNGKLSDSPTAAWRQIDTAEARKAFKDVDYDSLRTDIAGSYFYNRKPDRAFELASASADRSGEHLPMAGWVAGLSAWKLGKYDAAAKYFEKAAESPRASAWMVSGGAYWAARAHLRNREPQHVSHWLKKAAEHPRTFYGIIALKSLGMEQASFNWEVPALTDRHLRALSKTPAGKRAVALVDAERPELAEQELRRINPGKDKVLQEALVALSGSRGMPGLAMRMGSAFKNTDGDLYDAALYPDAPWKPEKGFEVDRALVYAFIRQESQFDPDANNRSSGARGLMQLMPITARHVSRYSGDSADQNRLNDPTVNIDIGQKYLNELLGNAGVEKNLFKLAVAYNAGPGKLARFQQEAGDIDDPLLFIESFPVAETRIFVERVLTNYWIYRIKFGQTTSSLDDVVQGDWPVYMAQDDSLGRRFAAVAANMFSQ